MKNTTNTGGEMKATTEYLIIWAGGSKRVNSVDRAKDTLMYASQSEGDLYDIHPKNIDSAKFNQHIKLF